VLPDEARFAFGSPEWFVVLGELVAELVADNPEEGREFVFSEQYENTPSEAVVGWHVVIRGSEAEFHASPRSDADFQIHADYAFVHETMAEVDQADPEARRVRRLQLAQAHEAGMVRFVGDPASAPKVLEPLHDLLARRTLSPTGSKA